MRKHVPESHSSNTTLVPLTVRVSVSSNDRGKLSDGCLPKPLLPILRVAIETHHTSHSHKNGQTTKREQGVCTYVGSSRTLQTLAIRTISNLS